MKKKRTVLAEHPTPQTGDPVSDVRWVKATDLFANGYNPNHVAPPEMELLKISIMEDGFTQPIVVKPSGEIVDGFHRWTLGSKDADLLKRYGGLVPVAILNPADEAHQMMSTVRHNRARGTHRVLPMGNIVRTLADKLKLPEAEIMKRLGMEDEEVERLRDTSGMTERGAGAEFGKGWEPA
jgi:ParB-like chromosome segregation protein Spo0J